MATRKFKIMYVFYIKILLDSAVWTKEENTWKYPWDSKIINGGQWQEWDTWWDVRGGGKSKGSRSSADLLADGQHVIP